MKKRLPFYLLLVALAILTCSLVIMRTESVAEDTDESDLSRAATAVAFGALTVGPAFMAEMVMRALPVATQNAKELARRQAKLREAKARQETAGDKITGINEQHDAYKFVARLARGRYYKIWRKARAEAGLPPDIPDGKDKSSTP